MTTTQTKDKTERRPALMKFRLLAGGHVQTDPQLKGLKDSELLALAIERGIDVKKDAPRPTLLKALGATQTFEADIQKGIYPTLESDVDLEARYGRNKFSRLSDGESPQVVERIVVQRVYFDPADATEAELRSYAEEVEIDLEGCDTRAKVLVAIKSATKKTGK